MTDAELLRAYLASHEANCPYCKYQLRGVEGEQCPECGHAIELQIRSTGATPSAWILCLLTSAAFGGFHGLVLIAFLIQFGRTPWANQQWFWNAFPMYAIGAMPYAITMPLLLAKRRTFLRRSPRCQWIWSLLLVVAFVVFELIWIGIELFGP